MANGFTASYVRTYWNNNTPPAMNSTNLNNAENGISDHDNKIVILDKTKLDITTANTMVADIAFDEKTGIITVTRLNGSVMTIDTQLEKIAINFDYDKETEQIILTLIDGTKQYIDLSALITQFEFLDTDTVSFFVSQDGKVSAEVKNGSITADKLEPNYLALITIQSENAEKSAQASKQSAEDANYNALMSQSYAIGLSGVREGEDDDNAKKYYEDTKALRQEVSSDKEEISSMADDVLENLNEVIENKDLAEESAQKAKESEDNAKASENAAKESEDNAKASENAAKESEDNAKASENAAKESEDNANQHALMSESYFHGGTGIRENEDEENVMAIYEKMQAITDVDIATESKAGLVRASEEVNVAFDGTMSVPKLSELESLIKGASSAEVYNNLQSMATALNEASIADFNIGTNILIKAVGVPDFWISEIYTEKLTFVWVSDEDLINRVKLSGGTLQIGYYGISFLETDKVDLTGIATESYVDDKFAEAIDYSDENLDTAKEYADNRLSLAANNQQPTFAEAVTRENIVSGEKMSIILGKVRKWFSDLKPHAFKETAKNLNTEVEGQSLDAVQGTLLKTNIDELRDDLDALSADLTNIQIGQIQLLLGDFKYGSLEVAKISHLCFFSFCINFEGRAVVAKLPEGFRPRGTIMGMTTYNAPPMNFDKLACVIVNENGNITVVTNQEGSADYWCTFTYMS